MSCVCMSAAKIKDLFLFTGKAPMKRMPTWVSGPLSLWSKEDDGEETLLPGLTCNRSRETDEKGVCRESTQSQWQLRSELKGDDSGGREDSDGSRKLGAPALKFYRAKAVK